MPYDDTPPMSNQNWVRLLIRDTSATPIFSDNEIDSFLTEARTNDSRGAKKWYVAGQLMDLLLAGNLQQTTDVSEEKVDELKVRYGSDGASAEKVMRELSARYNRQAARLSRRRGSRFRVVASPLVHGVDATGPIADRRNDQEAI